MEETVKERKKRLEMRDRHRNSTCVGCRANYYNFAKPRGENGDCAVDDDYSCYMVTEIKRGKCGCYQR